jgi:hypothetical protein
MTAVVIDTNVPVVANGRSPQANDDCISTCITTLGEIKKNTIVVLDSSGLIFDEYFRNLSRSGQPGPGDVFVKWLWDNQASTSHCEKVTITSRNGHPDDFEEFPIDPNLLGFDSSDRKFVAVALKSSQYPTILNAVDSDWLHYKEALASHGITIKFLCPTCIKEKETGAF